MEVQFIVTVYHLDNARAAELREALQDRILEEVEMRGLYMGPVIATEVPEEVLDGQKALA